MGCVYRAVQLSLDKTILIKVLHDKYRDDEISFKGFNEKPKRPPVYLIPTAFKLLISAWMTKHCTAMEYLEVGPFYAFKEHHPLGRQHRPHHAPNLYGAGRGTRAEHRSPGPKPENIMILNRPGHKDFVKVLDFGIAKILDPEAKEETLTQVGMVCGTPEYMSQNKPGARLWTLGATFTPWGCCSFNCAPASCPFSPIRRWAWPQNTS